MPDLLVPTEALARQAEAVLGALRAARRDGDVVHVHASGSPPETAVPLPDEALHLLLRILSHLADGDAVTVVPVRAELTPQQAADVLNVSRPWLVKLLDDGVIPSRRVGTDRGVSLRELLAYRDERRAEQQAAMDELTRESQGMGLYG